MDLIFSMNTPSEIAQYVWESGVVRNRHIRWMVDYDSEEREMGLAADIDELHEMIEIGLIDDCGVVLGLGNAILELAGVC